jgi:hypothetical protein
MDYYKIQYHIRELSKLIVESQKEGDIKDDKAIKQLYVLESLAYESFPHLEPDGDVTYGIAVLMDEIT